MFVDSYSSILLMSFIGGALYLLLKLSSRLTRKYFTASWHYFVYVGVVSCFVIPYYKLFSFIDLSFAKRIENGGHELLDRVLVVNPVAPNNPEFVLQVSGQGASLQLIDLLPFVLMSGSLIFVAVILFQNFKLNRRMNRICELTSDTDLLEALTRCRRELRINKEIPVYISPYMTTPFLCGLFKPRIIMPSLDFTREEYYQVFLHELTHYKRHDMWVKCMMIFINALHWFNPLAYMARRDTDELCELSCDERIIKSMNSDERRQYCELLLQVLWNVADQKVKLFSAFSDKGRHLERRVNMILNTEGSKRKNWIRRFVLVTTLALTSVGVMAVASTSFANKEDGVKGVISQPVEGLGDSATPLTNTQSDVQEVAF